MMRKILSILMLMIVLQTWGQDDIEVVNIENQAVRDYMADSDTTYTSNSDYRVSVITKYNDNSKYGSKLYWPNGKVVTWTPTASAADISEIRITVSENKDFKKFITHNPDDNDVNTYMIRNLLPNRTYYYKVEQILKTGEKEEMASGVFRTVGQVRMIQVRNCSNVRDLGGWPTQYGKPVKYGRLFRSASLERINSRGRHDYVENMNVVAELDLRYESKRTTNCLGSDEDYLRLGHSGYLEGMTKKNWVYVVDLQWINSKLRENKNVDWHCAIGCDRCGTLSFLIEGLLGLSELDLCRDYELSTLSLGKNNKRTRNPLKGMINHVKKFGPEDDLARCFYNYWLSIGAPREELDYLLSVMLGIPDISRITGKNR